MKPAHNKDYNLLVIGECLVEFSCDGDIVECESFRKDIGGADVVVAAAAARLGSNVQLISAVARDPFHSFIRDRLTKQSIDISHVVTCPGYNGVYFTSSLYPEQRDYLSHHAGTANQHIIPSLIYDDLVENCKIVYASSELQSVSRQTQLSVFKAFNFAHCNNTMVAYDPNLRLMRWTLDEAREKLWSVLAFIDIIFLSAPEESKALIGYERPLDVIGFLRDRGVSIVAVKTAADGCMVGYHGKVQTFQHSDTSNAAALKTPTLVGSAFNGAFLHAIACGFDPFAAAELANSTALYKGIKGDGIDSLPTAQDIKIK